MPVMAWPFIQIGDDGVAIIAGTRTKVIEIALERLAHGSSVEEIVEQHRGLISLAQVHAALAYYYDHEADLNAEIERQLETADRLRSKSLSSPGRLKLKQMGRL